MTRAWLIPAFLGCILLLTAFVFLRLNDVGDALRIVIVLASVLIAASVVGRSAQR